MSQYNSIFIKNIYYMLSYAFQNLRKTCDDVVTTENFDNMQDLFAVILYKGIYSQLKKGIYKEYKEEKECLSCLRGKINFPDTINTASLIDNKVVCEFDEYSEDTYLNQVLKSTIELLIRKSDIKKENKKLLKQIYVYFSQVKTIDIKRISWNSLSYHRNNASYKFLINICYLIIEGMTFSEESGIIKVQKYIDEQRMHKLYEKFILEFYRKHYPEFNANASYITWNIKDDILEFLPSMKSDIMLKYANKTLIIDAKFYSHTMQTQFEKKSFHSNNMYQIYTYVKNEDKTHSGDVTGMLLYAKTNEDVTPNSECIIDGNKFIIRTLDLNQEWKQIYNDLSFIGDNFKISASC